MPLNVSITRYDDLLFAPDSTVQWEETHQKVDSLRALELLHDFCRGPFGDVTTYRVTNESTGRSFTSSQLARVAYHRAKCTPALRQRFASWLVETLRGILYPWDDASPMHEPHDQYWFQAACRTRQLLDPRLDGLEGWLIESVNDAFDANFTTELARHDAAVIEGKPSCLHYRIPAPASEALPDF